MRRWLFLMIMLSLLIPTHLAWGQDDEPPATPIPTPEPPPPLIELNEINIKQATVFLMQVTESTGGPTITCVGSGTLVSADGLILTNAHNVISDDACPTDRIVVALTLRENEPPVPTYIAEILDASLGLDLAMLQITSFIDGRNVDASTLKLPFVEVGDSNQMALDDTVLFVGYPDIGDQPVRTVLGTISGFTAEARVGDRAWLRTEAPLPGVMSGGGAYDRNGRLIGIPTISPARISGLAVDCRSVQDSNGDGQVDDNDRCIPVSGFISAIRPSRLARGLVRASALGISLKEDFAPAVFPPTNEDPDFRRLFMATGVNAAGMPINVVRNVPAGTNSLYLFFDYFNMQNGMVYELRTTINGLTNPIFSLPPVTWNGGPRGMWYIGSSGVPWPNGTYEFTLFIEGRQVANHQITIGGAPQNTPSFSDVSFGLEDVISGDVVGTNFILPETNIVRAKFNYRNMTPETTWTQVWYLEGQELTPRQPQIWVANDQGVSSEAAIASEVGLLSGRYRLELYINDSLAATADFVIAGGAEANQTRIFSDFIFAGGEQAGVPQPPIGDTFVTGPRDLYVFFNWRQMSAITPWTWRWLVDGEILFESNTQWATAPTGERYYIAINGQPRLPDATYTFQIEMGGIVIANVEARIGLGQLPLDVFASAEGIQLNGYVRDAETGEGIPGAMFIMLLPEFSVEDFTWDEGQVLAISLADSNGYFQLPELLPRGTEDTPILYSLMVRAEGYFPMSADGIAVTDATESPMVIDVELNRD